MAGEVRRLKFAEGITTSSPMSFAVVVGQAGTVDLVAGESSKSFSFVTPMPDTTYNPVVSIECDDLDPIFINTVIQNKTVNGFDVKFNGAVDSNNYKLTYIIGA